MSRLISALKEQNSFYSVESPDSSPHFVESKYSLRTLHPELYYLDLTEGQAIALNSWSYFGGTMPDVLTLEQNNIVPRLKTALSKKSTAELRPWPLEAMKTEMNNHLDLTLKEASHRLNGMFAEDIKAYDEVHTHILHFADTLSSGIQNQFP